MSLISKMLCTVLRTYKGHHFSSKKYLLTPVIRGFLALEIVIPGFGIYFRLGISILGILVVSRFFLPGIGIFSWDGMSRQKSTSF